MKYNIKLTKRVIKIISKTLNIDIKDLSESSSSQNIKKWDSLAHIRIILLIEKNFKIKINTSQQAKLNSVKSIISYLSK